MFLILHRSIVKNKFVVSGENNKKSRAPERSGLLKTEIFRAVDPGYGWEVPQAPVVVPGFAR